MKTYILYFLLLFTPVHGYGQTDTLPAREVDACFLDGLSLPDSLSGGTVRVEGDPRVEELSRLTISVNERGYAFAGYRVQLLSVNASRVKVDSLQRQASRVEELFPGIRVYLQYVDPDFKIRVGNFRSRIEAIPLLRKIRRKYPSSYIVLEMIRLDELLEPGVPPGNDPVAPGFSPPLSSLPVENTGPAPGGVLPGR